MDTNTKHKFPTFNCKITHTEESFDSEIEYFLFQRHFLASSLGRLRVMDSEWSDNYCNMMQYIFEMTKSVINNSKPPSYQFLIELSMGEEIENDTIERLLNVKDESNVINVSELIEASIRVREMIFWFVRLSRDERFMQHFTLERFEGLPFLRLALSYRSVALSESHPS